MRQLLPIILAALLSSAGPAAAGPLEEAIAAGDRGDHAGALKIYQSLAAQGNADAEYKLGVMYANGQGVVQNYEEALKWYRSAAAQGHAGAQVNLGAMYVQGLGVAQDPIRAHMWFNLGAVSGAPAAVENRDRAAKHLTPQQIVQAQDMALDCQRRNFKGCD